MSETLSTWDQGTWDEGTWDSDAPVPPDVSTKRMNNSVKLQLTRRKGVKLAEFAQNHSEAMAANAALFVTPDPAPASFNPLVTAFLEAAAAQLTAQQVAKQRTQEKDAARRALEDALRARGAYVGKVAGGDAALINAAGFDVRSEASPSPVPATPENFSVKAGRYSGSMELRWNPVPLVRSYNVQVCPDPLDEEKFSQVAVVTRSNYLVRDLVPGQKYWLRVAAVAPAGQGAWCSAIMRVAA